MAGFKGQENYSIDAKGRVAIPAKMRNELRPEANNRFVLTRGLDKCIFVYPLDRWQKIEESLRELNTYDREARSFTRRIMMWAEEVELDSQGRIVIPKNLISFVELTERALILGALDRIEIWNPDNFDKYLNEEPHEYEDLAEKVMGL